MFNVLLFLSFRVREPLLRFAVQHSSVRRSSASGNIWNSVPPPPAPSDTSLSHPTDIPCAGTKHSICSPWCDKHSSLSPFIVYWLLSYHCQLCTHLPEFTIIQRLHRTVPAGAVALTAIFYLLEHTRGAASPHSDAMLVAGEEWHPHHVPRLFTRTT